MSQKLIKEISHHLATNKLSKVCIDSRKLEKGDVFIALQGENQHGNEYLSQAIKLKSAFIIADKNVPHIKDKSIYLSTNPETFLWKLATIIRASSKASFIAITGSNGKTTTKDICYQLLNNKEDTLKTQGNFNNLLGVPLTLCSLKPHHQYAVVECGSNHSGEIEKLCSIIKPHISVITSINAAHLSGFKNIQGIAKEKSSVFVDHPNVCFLREEDFKFSAIKEVLVNKNYSFFDKKTDFHRLKSVSSSKSQTWLYKKQKFTIHSPAYHNISNALVSIKIGEHFNIPLSLLSERLIKWEASDHRMCMIQWKKRKIIDDCYNANPASVVAALKTATSIKSKSHHNLFLVFGNMSEMGRRSNTHHKDLGAYFAETGVDVLLTYGDKAKMSLKPFSKNGGKSSKHFSEVHDIATFLKLFTQPHDIILIKGSRSMQLENILDDMSIPLTIRKVT